MTLVLCSPPVFLSVYFSRLSSQNDVSSLCSFCRPTELQRLLLLRVHLRVFGLATHCGCFICVFFCLYNILLMVATSALFIGEQLLKRINYENYISLKQPKKQSKQMVNKKRNELLRRRVYTHTSPPIALSEAKSILVPGPRPLPLDQGSLGQAKEGRRGL